MSRNRLIPVAAFVVGLAVGWAIQGRAKAHRHESPRMPDALISAKHVSIYQPRRPEVPAADFEPISIQHGSDLVFLSEAPADPKDVVLISFDHGALLVTCKKLK